MSSLLRTVCAVVLSGILLAGSSIDLGGQPTDNRIPTIALRASAIVKARRAASQLHPTGYRVIGRRNLVRIGGVLSQADSLTTVNGDPIRLTVELGSAANYPGYVAVRRAGRSTPDRYAIPYSDLVPMALFVDSGGTSLYTLWDRDSDRLPPDFQHDASFVDHHLAGMVSLEFYGTAYADALFFLDTCQGCVEPADNSLTEIIDDMNRATSADPPVALLANDIAHIDGTYINTDVDLPFRVRAEDGFLTVRGQIARLDPAVSDGRVVIATAQRVVRPERLLEIVQDGISRIENEVRQAVVAAVLAADDLQDIEDDLGNFQAVATMSSRMLLHEALLEEELQNVLFLFETLALLRTAKTASPEDWLDFLTNLASTRLADAHPEPWQRYLASFCSLYPSDATCQG